MLRKKEMKRQNKKSEINISPPPKKKKKKEINKKKPQTNRRQKVVYRYNQHPSELQIYMEIVIILAGELYLIQNK